VIIFKNLPSVDEPRLYMSLERTYLTYLKFILLAFGSGIVAKRLEIYFFYTDFYKLAIFFGELHTILIWPSLLPLLFLAVKFYLDIKYIQGGEKVSQKEVIDPRIYMAAERTFLAWIRTAIGLIAFGFVVEKFDFFLKQLSIMLHTNININGHFEGMGFVFIFFGISTLIIGGLNFIKTIDDINKGTYKTHKALYIAYGLIIFVCMIILASMLIGVNL